jgi:flagellum-specific ATP synthase
VITGLQPAVSPLADLARRMRIAAAELPFARPVGQVHALSSSAIVVEGLSHWLQLGGLVEVEAAHGPELAEVIRLERDMAYCKPYQSGAAIGLAAKAYPRGPLLFYPSDQWKGRVIDALARPADDGDILQWGDRAIGVACAPPGAMSRQVVGKGICTGVRVIDAFTPLCLGQRIGVFAGSGVGKSTLLSMLSQSDAFDVLVISLVGERGREVREFIEHTLGKAATKAITVVSTGDESPMMRRLAPLLATSLAEFFRDKGQQVLLIMDSVTRYAHACREVALSAGEPPVARGYPPSVFSQLPQLLERAGPGSEGQGTITGIYSVLVDGDDHNDPVADAVRGTLDGHIVLGRAIAEQGRYPAVDVLASLSRLSGRVWSPDQVKAVIEMKRLIARFEETRDLRAMGGLSAGADGELDRAVEIVPKLYRLLSQSLGDPASIDAFSEIASGLSREGRDS